MENVARRGRPPIPEEEVKNRYCKVRFNEYEWKRYKEMQEFSGKKGSEIVREALRYYDKQVLKRR